VREIIKLKIIFPIFILVSLLSCSETQDVKADWSKKPLKQKLTANKNAIEIQSTKIMGWWHKTVEEKGIDGDNPPKKENYVEIVNWRYDGEGISTYPKKIDFVSFIFNNSKESFSGIATFSLKAR